MRNYFPMAVLIFFTTSNADTTTTDNYYAIKVFVAIGTLAAINTITKMHQMYTEHKKLNLKIKGYTDCSAQSPPQEILNKRLLKYNNREALYDDIMKDMGAFGLFTVISYSLAFYISIQEFLS